eukprot:TRINITY_DN49213_c0_g1_i2.p1 TRINITY_DN49213_c0_g1~~TRINITY_DN49213_c0_g1_i2.p1  ORF type:complete len:468 (+),score=16.22 TRINITY_DN49213_c0_g1_i2:92-1405(+)
MSDNKAKNIGNTVNLCQAINEVRTTRLTSNRPLRRTTSYDRQPIQPSGPRAPTEGIDNQEQGIVHAELIEDPQQSRVVLYVTMLAAGFVIGKQLITQCHKVQYVCFIQCITSYQVMCPRAGVRGVSIRQICELTSTQIRSETIKPGRFPRTTRLFEITGSDLQCKQALDIIVSAVDLYKRLTEGQMEGQRVEQIQHAANIAFVYQPPPYRMVPQAAQLIQDNKAFVVGPNMNTCLDQTYQIPQMLSSTSMGNAASFQYQMQRSVMGGEPAQDVLTNALENMIDKQRSDIRVQEELNRQDMNTLLSNQWRNSTASTIVSAPLATGQQDDMDSLLLKQWKSNQTVTSSPVVGPTRTRYVLGQLSTNVVIPTNRSQSVPAPGLERSLSDKPRGASVAPTLNNNYLSDISPPIGGEQKEEESEAMQRTLLSIMENLNLGSN